MPLAVRTLASLKAETAEPTSSSNGHISDEADDGISYLPDSMDASDLAMHAKMEPKHDPDLDVHLEELRRMEQLGLPTGFTAADACNEVARKGEKKTFYCETCMIELNSEDTMTSHVRGMKHMKRALTEKERRESAQARGMNIPEKVIKQIANPRPLGKKIPIKLSEKLREAVDPVVGLRYISETIACSSSEMEPFYECLLCGNQGEANGMFNHLFGRGHREKFLQKSYPDDPKYVEPNRELLMSEVSRLRENDQLGIIHTIYSDELYPWSAGKAPWSVEKGGTGTAPTGVSAARRKRKEEILGERRPPPVGILELKEGGVKDVKDAKQLDHYYQLVSTIFDKVSKFHTRNCAEKDRDELETWHNMVRVNVQSMRNIPVNDADETSASTSSSSSRSPSSPSRSASRDGFKRERSSSSGCSSSAGRHRQRGSNSDRRSGKRSRF